MDVEKITDNRIRVNVGISDIVEIDKLYGPVIFADLRIRADYETGWVIERYCLNKWVEWVTIPAQLDDDFTQKH